MFGNVGQVVKVAPFRAGINCVQLVLTQFVNGVDPEAGIFVYVAWIYNSIIFCFYLQSAVFDSTCLVMNKYSAGGVGVLPVDNFVLHFCTAHYSIQAAGQIEFGGRIIIDIH